MWWQVGAIAGELLGSALRTRLRRSTLADVGQLAARIVGTGHYVPERRMTNQDMAARVITSDEWIRQRTGIVERRIMGEDEATSDMATKASQNALAAAGMTAQDIDLIIVCTVTADMMMPSCAAFVQRNLKAACPAFDLGAACAGFTFGLSVVEGLIKGGTFSRILLIGAEALSRFLDWQDRTTCILFGDGAGAIVVAATEVADDPDSRLGIVSSAIYTDGEFAELLTIQGGGTRYPPTHQSIADNRHVLRMDGKAVFSHAVRSMSDACEAVLTKAGVTAEQISWALPHQANLRIIDAMFRRLNWSTEKAILNLDKYGNTSSASIPIALDEAVRDGRIKPGQWVLTCGMGAGLAWGANLLKF